MKGRTPRSGTMVMVGHQEQNILIVTLSSPYSTRGPPTASFSSTIGAMASSTTAASTTGTARGEDRGGIGYTERVTGDCDYHNRDKH